MNAQHDSKSGRIFSLVMLIELVAVLYLGTGNPPKARAQGVETASKSSGQYFISQTIQAKDGTSLDETIINGPSQPPAGYELERQAVTPPASNLATTSSSLTVPAFDWSFGCSATSGAMIAGYYDRNGFPNMYTGTTNGGVMPLDNRAWPSWTDGAGTSYGQNPLAASHQGLDGRTTRGSIDDYWVAYGSGSNDPYMTNGWTQHTWGDAIGDYMKTSQTAFNNSDGATIFYNYTTSPTPLTCDAMATAGISAL